MQRAEGRDGGHNTPMLNASVDYYAALRARDRRFDGRFFVGVSSTGIYCRPICAVRTPRRENCAFFPSPAAAEEHGFRPCLRCRPELAPGIAPIDATERYAAAAARLIEQGFLVGRSVAALAARMGITDRHLRRVFADRFGVSPLAYFQTQRLLLAKHLLADTHLPITEVAQAAGFGSLRRFHDAVRERYRLSPSELRRANQAVGSGAPAAKTGSTVALRLGYRPPLDWPYLLDWLASRCVAGVESVAGDTYLRTLAFEQAGCRVSGTVRVRADPARCVLLVEPSASLLPALPTVLARLRRLFDLDAAPQDIATVLGDLALHRTGLRVPGAVGGFEGAARAVLEQQVSAKAASRLLGRLAERFGEPIDTPSDGLTRLFPSAEAVAKASRDAIAAIGIPGTRAQALLGLARATVEGRLDLDEVIDVERGMTALQAIPGIGPWTAGYIAMRAWSWPDVFLPGDHVIRRRFPELGPGALAAHAARWSPWRSYAVFHLWAAAPMPAA